MHTKKHVNTKLSSIADCICIRECSLNTIDLAFSRDSSGLVSFQTVNGVEPNFPLTRAQCMLTCGKNESSFQLYGNYLNLH